MASLCDAEGGQCFFNVMKDASLSSKCTQCLGDCDTVNLSSNMSVCMTNIKAYVHILFLHGVNTYIFQDSQPVPKVVLQPS